MFPHFNEHPFYIRNYEVPIKTIRNTLISVKSNNKTQLKLGKLHYHRNQITNTCNNELSIMILISKCASELRSTRDFIFFTNHR